MNFVVQFVIALVMMVAAYLLMPKPKMPSSSDAESMEDPKVSSGTPIKVVFGTKTVKDPNILWFGEKSTRKYKVKA